MAFNKKNKRKITVNENVFYWFYKFEKDILRLTVMTDEKTHSRLICDFDYKNFWLYFKDIVEGKDIKIPSWNLSPKIVRQIIDYAILNGWKPFEKGKDFVIQDIENKIDLDGTNPIQNIRTEIILKMREMILQNPKSKI